jgi:hypothetical protein
MTLAREIGIAVLMVMVTLWLQSTSLAALIHWIRPLPAIFTDLGRFPLCCAGCASHRCGNRFAWSVDSILGELLSPALFRVLGIRALVLGTQLGHGGLRRRSLTVKLANAKAAGASLAS